MGIREALTPYWPLFGLELRTPRLVLRPICDEDLPELLEAVRAGVHAPELMPFDFPWTVGEPGAVSTNSLKHYWATRADVSPAHWVIEFGVHLEGRLIGNQELRGSAFPTTRTVDSGSWIGRIHQGQGIGTEMRAAALQFVFDHLGAVRATSGAFVDNVASQRVSAKVGYRQNGTEWKVRMGEPAEVQRFVATPESFIRPGWVVEVSGLAPCLPLLLGDRGSTPVGGTTPVS